MGIVIRQSFKNTFFTYIGFAIGGINTLFLYVHFLKEEYYGLVSFVLATANIMMPLMTLGLQQALIRFFPSYTSKETTDRFLTMVLLLPLTVIIPVGFAGLIGYDYIVAWLSNKNPIIEEYTGIIFIIAVSMGYFELFDAWAKMKLQSVFGNAVREIFIRFCVAILLLLVYTGILREAQFVYALAAAFVVRMLFMAQYALRLYTPKITFKVPPDFKKVLYFSLFMLAAGSVGGILLDIDKFMIPQQMKISENAYYTVAVFIGTVLAVPGRAMYQILNPLTAKNIVDDNWKELKIINRKSATALLVLSGLLFLLINLNSKDLYQLLPEKYAGGIWVVFLLSLAKLSDQAIGISNLLLLNSKHYKVLFTFSIAMALSLIVMNQWLIGLYGIFGAGLATMSVMVFYNMAKVIFVYKKMRIHPFTNKTLLLLGLQLLLFVLFYFLQFHFHPLINIALKSALLIAVYFPLIKKMGISPEIFTLTDTFLKKITSYKEK